MITVERLSSRELSVEMADELWQQSLFSSPAFASVWKTTGGREVYWLTSENGQPSAILAGVEWGVWPFTRFQSMPNGLYARLYTAPDAKESVERLGHELARSISRAGYAKVFINDYHRNLPPLAGYEQLTESTTLVEISHREWEPPDRTLRQEVRRAEREGLCHTLFDIDLDMEPFLTLVRDADDRIGRHAKYSPSFFRVLAELGAQDRRVHWSVARIEQRLVASHIYFLDGNMALAWQIYFDKSAPQLKPNQYLLVKNAEFFASQGVRYLNLGSTPYGATGAASFKEKWGGVQFEYPSYRRRSFLGRLL